MQNEKHVLPGQPASFTPIEVTTLNTRQHLSSLKGLTSLTNLQLLHLSRLPPSISGNTCPSLGGLTNSQPSYLSWQLPSTPDSLHRHKITSFTHKLTQSLGAYVLLFMVHKWMWQATWHSNTHVSPPCQPWHKITDASPLAARLLGQEVISNTSLFEY